MQIFGKIRSSPTTALLLLYYCFTYALRMLSVTAALLLLYYCLRTLWLHVHTPEFRDELTVRLSRSASSSSSARAPLPLLERRL